MHKQEKLTDHECAYFYNLYRDLIIEKPWLTSEQACQIIGDDYDLTFKQVRNRVHKVEDKVRIKLINKYCMSNKSAI